LILAFERGGSTGTESCDVLKLIRSFSVAMRSTSGVPASRKAALLDTDL